MRRYVGTIAAVALAVILSLLLYKDSDIKTPKALQKMEVTLYVLNKFDIDTVTIEDLKSMDKNDASFQPAKITLRKNQNGFWELDEKNVDPDRMAEILDFFSTLRAKDVTSENKKPNFSVFELDEPHKVLRIKTKSGVKQEVLFGRRAPLGGNTYLTLKDNERVFIMPSELVSLLTTKKEDLWLKPETQPAPGVETRPAEH